MRAEDEEVRHAVHATGTKYFRHDSVDKDHDSCYISIGSFRRCVDVKRISSMVVFVAVCRRPSCWLWACAFFHRAHRSSAFFICHGGYIQTFRYLLECDRTTSSPMEHANGLGLAFHAFFQSHPTLLGLRRQDGIYRLSLQSFLCVEYMRRSMC